MPSFDRVNYYVRTNKNVERKLIFDSLKSLGNLFEMDKYRYVGFGSLWFVDLLLAHKVLGITDLISIEHDETGISRAHFNKPLSCIKIIEGESTKVIPDLDLREKPLISWLDYDSQLDESMLEDIRMLCAEAPSGSIVLVTLNAHVGQLSQRIRSEEDVLESIESTLANPSASDSEKLHRIISELATIEKSKNKRRKEALTTLAGKLVPAGLSNKDLRKVEFPKLLARILLNQFTHSMLDSGRSERFFPLFNYFYSDNAPMITVGGMVANSRDAKRISKSRIRLRRDITGERPFQIKVPPLTIKEKISLDQLLPMKGKLTQGKVYRKYRFMLKEQQLLAYQQFYKLYPIYGELDF